MASALQPVSKLPVPKLMVTHCFGGGRPSPHPSRSTSPPVPSLVVPSSGSMTSLLTCTSRSWSIASPCFLRKGGVQGGRQGGGGGKGRNPSIERGSPIPPTAVPHASCLMPHVAKSQQLYMACSRYSMYKACSRYRKYEACSWYSMYKDPPPPCDPPAQVPHPAVQREARHPGVRVGAHHSGQAVGGARGVQGQQARPGSDHRGLGGRVHNHAGEVGQVLGGQGAGFRGPGSRTQLRW